MLVQCEPLDPYSSLMQTFTPEEATLLVSKTPTPSPNLMALFPLPDIIPTKPMLRQTRYVAYQGRGRQDVNDLRSARLYFIGRNAVNGQDEAGVLLRDGKAGRFRSNYDYSTSMCFFDGATTVKIQIRVRNRMVTLFENRKFNPFSSPWVSPTSVSGMAVIARFHSSKAEGCSPLTSWLSAFHPPSPRSSGYVQSGTSNALSQMQSVLGKQCRYQRTTSYRFKRRLDRAHLGFDGKHSASPSAYILRLAASPEASR